MGQSSQGYGHACGVAGPYPIGSFRRTVVKVALAIGRPVHEVAAYDPRTFATIVEEVTSDNGNI